MIKEKKRTGRPKKNDDKISPETREDMIQKAIDKTATNNDGKVNTRTPAEMTQEIQQHHMQQAQACSVAVQAVLKEYNCKIEPYGVIRNGDIQLQANIVFNG